MNKNPTIRVSGTKLLACSDHTEVNPTHGDASSTRIDGSLNRAIIGDTAKTRYENCGEGSTIKSADKVKDGGGLDNTIVIATHQGQEPIAPDKHPGKRSDGRHETYESTGAGGTVNAHCRIDIADDCEAVAKTSKDEHSNNEEPTCCPKNELKVTVTSLYLNTAKAHDASPGDTT